MLIYGSKMYGVKNVVRGFGDCPHCGKHGKYRSYDGRKWGHLYFIPLIPEGKRMRVIKECKACQMGTHLQLTEVPALYAQTEQLMHVCVEAATAGRRSFPDPESGEEIGNDAYLMETIDLLYNLGHADDVEGLIQLLDTQASRYEHGIAMGIYHEAQGRNDQAVNAYKAASEVNTDRPLPDLLLGDMAMRQKNPAAAIEYYNCGLALVPGDLNVMLAKANALEQLGNWAELGELIDQMIEIEPSLAGDKRLRKLRKKCQKKSGR